MEGSNSSNSCCDFQSYWHQRIHVWEKKEADLGFHNTKYSSLYSVCRRKWELSLATGVLCGD